MKTAIYIEDGIVQLVITPESDFEKSAIGSIANKPTELQVFNGTFYDCRGGWTRQSDYDSQWGQLNRDSRDKSLIIRVSEAK